MAGVNATKAAPRVRPECRPCVRKALSKLPRPAAPSRFLPAVAKREMPSRTGMVFESARPRHAAISRTCREASNDKRRDMSGAGQMARCRRWWRPHAQPLARRLHCRRLPRCAAPRRPWWPTEVPSRSGINLSGGAARVNAKNTVLCSPSHFRLLRRGYSPGE